MDELVFYVLYIWEAKELKAASKVQGIVPFIQKKFQADPW